MSTLLVLVANRAIRPEHLVDHNLQTAWNSATDDLVDAWIEVTVPDDAPISELRLTAGHTGTGPRGEDYFTMNPRLQRVTVTSGDTLVGRFPLDPAQRGLQTLAIQPPSSRLRLRVDAIVPGSKPAWREVAISELEAWGRPPAGFAPPAAPLTPVVSVGHDPVGGDDLDADCNARLADALTTYRAYVRDLPGSADGDEPPRCETSRVPIAQPRAPWTGAGISCLHAQYSLITGYSRQDCKLLVASGDRWWSALAVPTPPEPDDPPRSYHWGVEVFEARIVDRPDPQLLLRYRLDGTDDGDAFLLCRTQPNHACSEPIPTSGPGWKTRPRFTGRTITIEAESGTPPDGELGELPALRFL
jgi:hypothetical protein